MPSVNRVLLTSQVTKMLLQAGFNREEIGATIRAWEYAHLSEKYSHGFDRLPWLLDKVRLQKVIPDTELVIEHRGLVTNIKGSRGVGYLAAEIAVQEVMELGKVHGIGFTGIYNCYPTGCMGQYTEALTQKNLIGFVITHSPPLVAPYQSATAVFSTCGHSLGFPSNGVPYILDSSVGAVTNGQIMMHHRLNSKLPDESVLSRSGTFTVNTSDVVGADGSFDGVIVSAGGLHSHKFSGLAGSLELLTRLALIGNEEGRTASYSLFISINPALFGDVAEYKALVDELQKKITTSKPIAGEQEVFFAGQQSYSKRQENEKSDTFHISEDTYRILFTG